MLKFQRRSRGEVWNWRSNFFPHFTGHVITYPCHQKGPMALGRIRGVYWTKYCRAAMTHIALLHKHAKTRACFLSLAQSKLRLCSANHRTGYWSNLPCDWPSTAWAYSEQETENGPWSTGIAFLPLWFTAACRSQFSAAKIAHHLYAWVP